jgi:hypothetical protein
MTHKPYSLFSTSVISLENKFKHQNFMLHFIGNGERG